MRSDRTASAESIDKQPSDRGKQKRNRGRSESTVTARAESVDKQPSDGGKRNRASAQSKDTGLVSSRDKKSSAVGKRKRG